MAKKKNKNPESRVAASLRGRVAKSGKVRASAIKKAAAKSSIGK